jgi:putative transcriptional regulator
MPAISVRTPILALLLSLSLAPVLANAQAAEERGVLLVAAPGHGAPHFEQAVLLLKRHAYGSTLGVMLNRPTDTHLGELFPGVDTPEDWAGHLFDGGPASPEQLVFLVRTRSHAPRNALHVFDRVFLSHDTQLLADILRHPVPLLGVRVFLGHARWDEGELEQAIARGEWYLAEADADSLFEGEPGNLWATLVERIEAQWPGGRPR